MNPNLSWTHYRTLLRSDDPSARAFYEIEAIKNNWSARELERQINSLLYERLAKSRDKSGLMRLATKGHEIQRPEDVFKDPVVIEFLGLPESHRLVESNLEEALITNLQLFLLELGKGFAFVSRQERITLEGVMAIILPHGVLFRGGAEERIRTKLLKDGHIDTVIGLPANLFYSTGIPVCILVLKKCKKPDDVLFINAAEHFVKGKRQNQLTEEHIAKIIDTYQFRKDEERYSRRISMERIAEEGYNLNISRYISTAVSEEEVVLADVHQQLTEVEKKIQEATERHNEFLKELGLPLLP